MNLTEWFEKLYKPKEKLRQLMNPNTTTSLTKKDKATLRIAVTLEWCDYVDSLTDIDTKTKEYLKKNFAVSILFRFIDKWENREAVYYFTTAKIWMSQ